jgi:hypothetical protein
MEQFANNANTTLNGSINNTTTTVVVNVAASFPSSPNFRILIDSEIMLVTGVASNTFTVSRAQENTVATVHNNGTNVIHIFTSGALQQFRADTISSGTYSSLPAEGTAGRIYLATDSP